MFATADMETDPFLYERKPQPFCVGYYDGNFCYSWGENCLEEFVDFISDKDIKIYFHNGGRFDFHFLIKYASKIFAIKNRIARMKIGKATLLDSYLLIPLPLRLSGGKLDFDYGKLEADKRDHNFDEIIDYLEQDCVALHNWLARYESLFGLNKITLPSVGMDQLQKTGFEIPRIEEKNDDKFRPYYYGGLVGHKRGYYENVKHIDINSSYPYSMLKQHPVTDAHDTSFEPMTDNYFATIRCDAVPYLPLREHGKANLQYADTGIQTYKLTNWELDACIKHGLIEDYEFLECISFYETSDFSEFVHQFYDMKLNAEKAGDMELRTFAKLLMNSVYGKFGINPRKFTELEITELGNAPKGDDWELVLDTDADTSIWERPKPSDRFICVATAASITGASRSLLIDGIANAVDPVYWDTDCVICANEGTNRLGDQLGDYGIEAEYSELWVVGNKLYGGITAQGKHKVAHKGVQLDLADIQRLAAGKPVTWNNMAPSYTLGLEPTFISRTLHYPLDTDSAEAV